MDTTSTHRLPLSSRSLGAARSTAALGTAGEQLAAQHLTDDHGLDIVARNWRLAAGELRGELDLIAADPADGTLIVCEVKTRRDADRFGGAVTALTPRQRHRVRALSAAFLRQTSLAYAQVRLDLIAVDVGRDPSLTHLEGAL